MSFPSLEIEHRSNSQINSTSSTSTQLKTLTIQTKQVTALLYPIQSKTLTMENVKARNEQLKNEAVALCTTLGQEINNETRATFLAKLYTILFHEQLSADPQASIALSMILTVKGGVRAAMDLGDFIDSGGMSTPPFSSIARS